MEDEDVVVGCFQTTDKLLKNDYLLFDTKDFTILSRIEKAGIPFKVKTQRVNGVKRQFCWNLTHPSEKGNFYSAIVIEVKNRYADALADLLMSDDLRNALLIMDYTDYESEYDKFKGNFEVYFE